VFYLRIMKKFGLDMIFEDNDGNTPLCNAIKNYSYSSIEFLANEYPDTIDKALEKENVKSFYDNSPGTIFLI